MRRDFRTGQCGLNPNSAAANCVAKAIILPKTISFSVKWGQTRIYLKTVGR